VDLTTAQQIKDELFEAGFQAVRAGMDCADKPDRLYHFTECQGLIGILTSRCLWASLATGLNDNLEVQYGLLRAERLLRAGRPGGIDPAFLTRVAYYLNSKNTSIDRLVEFDAYVISFCAREDLSVHWLHYGKSGTGCAIRFDTERLIHPPFDLTQIIYDETRQDQFIEAIIEKKWSIVRRYKLDTQDSRGNKILYEIAADSAAKCIRAGSPMLKSPAFTSEEEWRLITYDVRVDGLEQKVGTPLATKFRAATGRVVPYCEYSFDEIPITDVVIGASFPMAEEDPALVILFRNTVKGRPVNVVRSVVPIRP
jgi:hypothetical protein